MSSQSSSISIVALQASRAHLPPRDFCHEFNLTEVSPGINGFHLKVDVSKDIYHSQNQSLEEVGRKITTSKLFAFFWVPEDYISSDDHGAIYVSKIFDSVMNSTFLDGNLEWKSQVYGRKTWDTETVLEKDDLIKKVVIFARGMKDEEVKDDTNKFMELKFYKKQSVEREEFEEWKILYERDIAKYTELTRSRPQMELEEKLGPTRVTEKVTFNKGCDIFGTEECSICLAEFEDGSEVIKMPCKHIYHQNCIFRWLASKNNSNRTCPDCRKELSNN